MEYRITAEPATLASKGKEGIVVSRDYRGVPVLAAYRHIKISPDSGWGLVVKVDQDGDFWPDRARVVYASFVSLLGIIAIAILATVIAGRIARPIQNLSLTAREVETGNLNARATVVGSDEVGNLAATFNSMIERVQNWHNDLEEQVKSRTHRLTDLNAELTREVAERRRAEERIQQNTGSCRPFWNPLLIRSTSLMRRTTRSRSRIPLPRSDGFRLQDLLCAYSLPRQTLRGGAASLPGARSAANWATGGHRTHPP